MPAQSGTEPQNAPAPVPQQEYIQARNLTVERQGQGSAQYSERFPQVRGGVCEFCGIQDPLVAAEHQYKMCPHYRGMMLRCSYCDETKNPDEVAGKSVLNVAKHPDNPSKLVVWCDSFSCSEKHLARFKIGT